MQPNKAGYNAFLPLVNLEQITCSLRLSFFTCKMGLYYINSPYLIGFGGRLNEAEPLTGSP